jgi:hypothetical protein
MLYVLQFCVTDKALPFISARRLWIPSGSTGVIWHVVDPPCWITVAVQLIDPRTRGVFGVGTGAGAGAGEVVVESGLGVGTVGVGVVGSAASTAWSFPPLQAIRTAVAITMTTFFPSFPSLAIFESVTPEPIPLFIPIFWKS